MQVGVNILNFGPGVGVDALGRWARLAEDLGYHSIMISDHVAMTPDVRERYPEPFYDPFATVAWMAGQTKRVKLGTTVCVLPFRHPILTARLTANIDSLSGGRVLFGIGLRGDGIPRLKRIAEEEGKPVPALCPRLRFRITDSPVTDAGRHAGTGALEQLHEDFTHLQELGVQHVILDWYTDDLDLTRYHEWG